MFQRLSIWAYIYNVFDDAISTSRFWSWSHGIITFRDVENHLSKTVTVQAKNGCFLGQVVQKWSIWALFSLCFWTAIPTSRKVSIPCDQLRKRDVGNRIQKPFEFLAQINAFGVKWSKNHPFDQGIQRVFEWDFRHREKWLFRVTDSDSAMSASLFKNTRKTKLKLIIFGPLGPKISHLRLVL